MRVSSSHVPADPVCARRRARGCARGRALEWAFAAAGALGALLAGCTDASLYALSGTPSQPDRIALSGRVCTDNPADRSFPLRVIFVVDSSPWMATLDPTNVRIPALEAAVNAVLSPARPNRQVAIERYAGEPQIFTDGFTADATVVTEAVAQTLASTCAQGCRDMEAALSLAGSAITGDLLRAPAGDRSRTRYLIVLMASGPPLAAGVPPSCDDECEGAADAPACLRACITERLRGQLADLRDFARAEGVADLALHAVHLRNLDPEEATALAWAEDTLRQLAEEGGGQYVGFDSIEGFTYLGLSFESLESPFTMSNLLASNVNVRVGAGGPATDSDADGLADGDEEAAGTRADMRDTDGDGLGDRLELLLSPTGLDPASDPAEPDEPAVCADLPAGADSDADGLTDCEELLLGTDPTLVDSDADGAPDRIEFLWGTNYLAADVLGDLDQDGAPNGSELALHSDPRANDPEWRADLGYQYSVISEGVTPRPYFGELVLLTGVALVDASPATRAGVGRLLWDSVARALAWQDPGDYMFGAPVAIEGDGRYVLQAESSVQGEALGERSVTADVVAADLPADPLDEEVQIGFVEQECVNFRVSNILVRGTLATDQTVEGTNDLYLWFGEVPRENPLGVPLYRAALARVTFLPPDLREPPGDEIVLSDVDFVLLGEDAP